MSKSKFFNIDKNTSIKYIKNIRKTASQISIGNVKNYRKAIEEYLKFTGEKIKESLGKDHYVIMVYYSFLIENQILKRITVLAEKDEEYIQELKKWYDDKCNSGEAFSLVPESLASHSRNEIPRKYLLKLASNKKVSESSCKLIDISSCYKNGEWGDNWFEDIKDKKFDNVLGKLEKSPIYKNILKNIRKLGLGFKINGKKLNRKQLLPFIIVWYPLYKEGWHYQYYIPSPMLSDTPVGGLVVGTKNPLSKDEVDNLEDIALKVSVEINSLEHKEKVMQQSRRTAVSAIMGRNMSHNIGSHVLWHLAQTATADKSFYDYIRERMGFVGLISTTSPSWSLEYDLTKVIDIFKGQTLLLNNLVKTEKKNLDIVVTYNDNCKKDVELPHGSYGAHAFYTILENIIRNTVKHNIEHVNNKVIFTISSEDSSKFKDYIKVKITDNLKKYSKELNALINDLNKKTEEKIIDKDGKLINRHLGFKEKRICAAFLRLIPQEAIDCKFKPPLLQVENNSHLTHVIYLKKPKKALIITDNQNVLTQKISFQEKGFYVGEKKDFLNIKDFTHQFLVLDINDNNEIKKFFEGNKLRLPFRILIKDDFCGEVIPSDADKCYFFLWKKWFAKYFNNGRKDKRIHLIENKTTEWETNINKNCCPDKKMKVIKCKKEEDDYDPKNNIVLSHNIKISRNKTVYKNTYYIEGIKSGGGDSGLHEMINKLEPSPFLLYKLLETFLLKIAIVDERIYEKIDDNIGTIEPSDKWDLNGIKFGELWKKRQVKIINHDEIIKNNNWNSIYSFNPDILIMHQGVIDKYKDKYNAEKFNQKWGGIKKAINHIIIDSDRGKPPDIKKLEARWLQFSDLSNIVIDKAKMNIAKYLLVSLVTSIRED